MAYASRAGRARTNPRAPQAHAICDRCGTRINHVDLRPQWDWRGTAMQNLRILVCERCYDQPQEQLRAIVLPIDPPPIINARPEWFIDDETDYRTVAGSTIDPVTGISIPNATRIITEDGVQRTPQPIGVPDDFDPAAVMPLNRGVAYGVLLSVLSLSSTGGNIITATCSAPHGLATNAQIIAEGLTRGAATGLYSVTVITATAFSYQTAAAIPAGGLLTSTSRIITALVGLPYGYVQVPQGTPRSYTPPPIPPPSPPPPTGGSFILGTSTLGGPNILGG